MHLYAIRWLIAVAVWLVTLCGPVQAASLLRDPDIEYALARIAEPVLRSAGLSPSRVRILLVDDRKLNAFVVDGTAIFVHSGLVLKLESAAQLQSVIAHEVAHIANGHIARRTANLQSSRTAIGLGLALAVAVAASGNSEAAGGIALGATGTAQRLFFAHTRAEEASADQSAIRYLLGANVNPAASVEVLEIFRGQEALSVGRQDPYVRSHPLTTDRLGAMRGLVAANPGRTGDTADADYWFARAHGKLSAFTQNASWTLRRVSGKTDLVSTLRAAVALHRKPDRAGAISTIAALVARYPNDPFLFELQGQILLENREFQAAERAYRRATVLAPSNALILGGHGRALLALNTAQSNRQALTVLERARARDGEDARILRDLGVAHAKNGHPGQASLAIAERYALLGRIEDAKLHANRALGQLARGSAPWQRAQDVVIAAEQLERR